MGNLQEESVAQQARQLAEQNVSGQVFRMFICTNIDEVFNVNVTGGQEMKEKKKLYWNGLAEKIIIKCPLFYKLLCIFKINKVYARIMRRYE